MANRGCRTQVTARVSKPTTPVAPDPTNARSDTKTPEKSKSDHGNKILRPRPPSQQHKGQRGLVTPVNQANRSEKTTAQKAKVINRRKPPPAPPPLVQAEPSHL